MAIEWLNRLNQIYDYDMSTHVVGGAVRVQRIREGSIHRSSYPLSGNVQEVDVTELKSMKFISKANSKQRRKIASKINCNWAGKGGIPEIGKASSCFLYINANKIVLDYIVESASHVRDGAPVMHDHLRKYADCNGHGMTCQRSGHIVPMYIGGKYVGWLMLFDAYSGANVRQQETDLEQVFATLIANRIIPISCDGYLI